MRGQKSSEARHTAVSDILHISNIIIIWWNQQTAEDDSVYGFGGYMAANLQRALSQQVFDGQGIAW